MFLNWVLKGPLQMSIFIIDQSHTCGKNEKIRVNMSFRVISYICITEKHSIFCTSFLKAITLHLHTFPGRLSQKWSNWENFLCEKIYTDLKKRYIFIWKKIPEHCSLTGSKCIQLSFCYENRDMNITRKFSCNMLSMNQKSI